MSDGEKRVGMERGLGVGLLKVVAHTRGAEREGDCGGGGCAQASRRDRQIATFAPPPPAPSRVMRVCLQMLVVVSSLGMAMTVVLQSSSLE